MEYPIQFNKKKIRRKIEKYRVAVHGILQNIIPEQIS